MVKRRVLHDRLSPHRLRLDDEDKSRVPALDVLRLGVKLLASPVVRLLRQLVKLACD